MVEKENGRKYEDDDGIYRKKNSLGEDLRFK